MGTSEQSDAWRIRCVCGMTEAGDDDDEEAWIGCDKCGVWQHNVCMGISVYQNDLPQSYFCEACDPNAHTESLDAIRKSEKIWEDRRKKQAKEDAQANQDHSTKQRQQSAPGKAVTTHGTQSFSLTHECHHYTRRQDVDWDIQKYWDQRFSIFSKYNDGIYMTDDSWFGVTPEPVAKKVAEDLAAISSPGKNIIIDLFAGAGGNSIAFALSNRWANVIAIEKDRSVIACAQNNAAIYGVAHKITWVHDDCFSYLSSASRSIDTAKTVIFASPPWGGPGYRTDEVFNLSTMQPYSVKRIHDACMGMDSALYLPRTSDLRQIARLAPKEKKLEIVQYCLSGASKALVAYIPAAATITA